jgi:integral membrane sensor domain MASE1
MTDQIRKYIKITVGVIGTIVLGAIGSGLWERVVGPFLDWSAKISVGAISWIITSYKDSIYLNAAKGFHEAHSLALYVLVLSLLPIFYLMLLRRHPAKKADKEQDSIRDFVRSKKGYWFIYALTFIVIAQVLFSALRLRHVNETITYSLASFEIIRPYVGEDKYLLYRSRYFSMRSANDFYVLQEEISVIAKTYNLPLPVYEPL